MKYAIKEIAHDWYFGGRFYPVYADCWFPQDEDWHPLTGTHVLFKTLPEARSWLAAWRKEKKEAEDRYEASRPIYHKP